MNILALDVGDVRIGVALGNAAIGIAHARDVIRNGEHAFDAIIRLISDEKIGYILVGHPRGLGGQTTKQTLIVEAFAERLKEMTHLPIELVDERLSTVAAHANLRAAALKTKHHRAYVDSEAARILLQEWFDSEND